MSKTENLSLGALLALNQREEAENTRAAAERAALAESEKALAEFKTVEAFFENAKVFFETGIRARTPVKKLSIMVGREYKGHADNEEVYRTLRLYQYPNAKPGSLYEPTSRYHSLWVDFEQWCARNSLKPKWVYTWDGGGMSSWFHLEIEPAPELAQQNRFVNPNNVQSQHAYCLQVLNATLDGLLKAADTLEQLSSMPQAAKALKDLDELIRASKRIKNQLNS